MEQGYWIYWRDTETNAEQWEAITAEEWKALWGDSRPTMRQLQERFIALAASYGLECDRPPRREKPLW